MTMEFKPEPDRMVGLGSPRTVHIYCPFKVKNRSIRKKHGTVRTVVRPSGSVNYDRFTWSNRLPCFSLKRRHFVPFFPPNMASFGAFWLNNPEMKPSGPSLSQSLSRLCLSPSSPSQLSPDRSLAKITAHSLPLSHAHRSSAVAAHSLPRCRRRRLVQ